MSTSALKLITGVIDGKSIRNNVNQAAHGFTAGSVVRYDVNHSDGDGGFTAAKAISSMEAEVSGIVERVVDTSSFVLVYQGEIDLSNIATTGNTADEVYFLSSDTAGSLAVNPPTVAGHVIKPVLVRRSDTSGLVMNYLGTVIGGEATVSLDGLVPVGTIYPYAGSSSDVPAGWSVCDGGTLDTARYPEVYPRISWNYGVTQKLTLTDNSGNIADLSSVSVGDVVEQDIQRPHGMPEDGTDDSGGIALINDVAKGTVVSKDTTEGTLHVSVQVTNETSGNISTGPLFDNTATDGGVRPGSLKEPNGSTFQVTKNEVEYVHKPDLRSRVPVGANHGDTSRTGSLEDVLQREWYRGKIGGQAAHKLDVTELAIHSHSSGDAAFGSIDISVSGSVSAHSHNMTTKSLPSGRVGPFTTTLGNHYHHLFDTTYQSQSSGLIAPDASSTVARAYAGAGGSSYEYIAVKGTQSAATLGKSSIPKGTDWNTSGNHQHEIPTEQIEDYLVTKSGGGGAVTSTGSISAAELEGAITIPSATDSGGDLAHNNMQPYLVTEYIIRISSEARAALVTGIDVNLSLEGLNNVADAAPAANEMIRHSGSVYEKITPNIDGLSSKDNKDLVVHTSQSAAGATLEHMRISTSGKVFVGATQGNTADMPSGVRTQLVVKNTQSDLGSYAFFQGQGAGQIGNTGTFFGHVSEATTIWNASAHSTRPNRNISFYFNDSGNNSVVYHRMQHYGMAIGGNAPRSGCSLDVQGGNLGVAGDIYTYGATQGVFASVLGVTATLGGYNLPVTAGVSGEVLMVHGTGKTLGFFAQAAPTVLWSGDAATGASCSAVNVAIGTGGNGAGTAIGKMGATLEVGGGAIIHGGMTVGLPVHFGLGEAHSTDTDVALSVHRDDDVQFNLKSNNQAVAIEMNPGNEKGGYLSFLENGTKRGQIHHQGNQNRMKISAYDTSLATDAYVTAIDYDMNAKLSLGNDSAIDTDFLVATGTAGTSGGILSRAGFNLFGVGASSGVIIGNGSSPVQVLRSGTGKTGAYVQIGSAHFGVSAGTFIGEGVGGHSEIQALADTGGTLDFHVGKATGSTLAMKIHNGGLVQIGATSGGGYAIEGISSVGSGLAVVDYTGSTGNSGDVLLNVDNTGLTRWGYSWRVYELDTHGLPVNANFSNGSNKANNSIETGTYRAQDFGVPAGATHIQIELVAEMTKDNPASTDTRVTHYCSGPSDVSAKRISLLNMKFQSNTGLAGSSEQALLPVDADGLFTLTVVNGYGSADQSSFKVYGYAI